MFNIDETFLLIYFLYGREQASRNSKASVSISTLHFLVIQYKNHDDLPYNSVQLCRIIALRLLYINTS